MAAAHPNQFKNKSGTLLTRDLFYETTLSDKENVLYTLKRDDHEGYPSLYRLYMESILKDPTEYEFAITHLDGWDHWERLCESSFFQPHISKWRREADIRRSAIYLRTIQSIAKSSSRESLAASRYLLEKGWIPKEKNAKGRPSKEDIQNEARRQAELDTMTAKDAERLGIRLS